MFRLILKLLSLLFVISWIISMNGCMNFRKSDKKVLKHFQDKNIDVRIHHKEFNGKSIRYIETGLQDELKKMETDWASIQKPVIHFHGTKDELASFENIAFSKKHIPADLLTTVEMEGKGHLIVWTTPDIIKSKLVELVDEVALD